MAIEGCSESSANCRSLTSLNTLDSLEELKSLVCADLPAVHDSTKTVKDQSGLELGFQLPMVPHTAGNRHNHHNPSRTKAWNDDRHYELMLLALE